MILVSLLLAQAQIAAADDTPPDEIIEPRAAAQTFVDTCWRGLRDPAIFDSAVAGSPLGFKPTLTHRPLRRFRAKQAELQYGDSVCGFLIKVKTTEDAQIFLTSLTRRLGVAEPSQGWVRHAFWKAAFQWRDVPIADGVYRWRGTIQHPNPIRDPGGPHVIDVTLGFTTWKYPQ